MGDPTAPTASSAARGLRRVHREGVLRQLRTSQQRAERYEEHMAEQGVAPSRHRVCGWDAVQASCRTSLER